MRRPVTSTTAPRTTTKANGQAHVCMIAYTDYSIDARVRREAETLAANGFQVRCLTTRNGGAARQFTLEGVDVEELRVTKYRGKSTREYMSSYLQFLAAASVACLRLMARRELDVVHVHNIPDFLVLAGLLPRLTGRKVVLDVHDSVPETFAAKFSNGSLLQRALRLEERLSALVAHRVICVNHPQRDALVSRGIPDAKTFISMNVPDPRIFGMPPQPVALPQAGALRLVYHGTMVHRLGVDLLIQAVARLKDAIPGVRLHLWGHGDDLPAFEALAVELGVQDHVEFNGTGYPLHELPERLRGMDLGVIGNRRSAAGDLMLPVKLLEYVSLGIPSVVPRLRTIAHYFTNEMVTFYEPDDVDSLAAAIRGLHGQADVRRRQAAEARDFLTQYGWERQGQELVTMYRTLVENGNR
jgi:glycosyltransferase involved in cell wall biosynthesis